MRTLRAVAAAAGRTLGAGAVPAPAQREDIPCVPAPPATAAPRGPRRRTVSSDIRGAVR